MGAMSDYVLELGEALERQWPKYDCEQYMEEIVNGNTFLAWVGERCRRKDGLKEVNLYARHRNH